MIHYRVGLALLILARPALAQQAPEAKPEVLVLGTYHMANPGRDLFNMQADDVLAPKRQAEIAEVIAVLKRFNPTKVAVEATIGEERIPKRYADYLAGKYELTRNETEQIGFRLAKELGHKTIYAVDVDGEFPFKHISNLAKASGRSKELDAMMGEVGAMVKAQNDYLTSHSVLEMLLYMNADKKVADDIGWHYNLVKFDEAYDWAGADLLASWIQRNLRIYSNIVNLVDSPNERVVAIFGAGHLGWLQHNVASNPELRLRKLAELTK